MFVQIHIKILMGRLFNFKEVTSMHPFEVLFTLYEQQIKPCHIVISLLILL